MHFAKEGKSKLEDTTWAEIAVDFQHATHEDLDRQDAEDATLERRARFSAAATKQMAKICKTNILGKAFRRKHNDKSNSLRPPGWSAAAGMPRRIIFLCPQQTLETLYRTAVAAGDMEDARQCSSMKIKPRMENAVAPISTESVGVGRKRLTGKQKPPEQWLEQRQAMLVVMERAARNRKRALPHKLVASKVGWSAEEKKKLSGLVGRVRQLQEKMLLHNRKAAAEKMHVMKLLAPRSKQLPSVLECVVCGCNITRAKMCVFLDRKCGKPKAGGGQVRGREDNRQEQREATRKAWYEKLREAGHIVDHVGINEPDQTLHCKRCLRIANWARVGQFVRTPCEEGRDPADRSFWA